MLEHINEKLSNIITYELGENTSTTIQFPYWIGEFQEIEYDYEEEYHEYVGTLTGTNKETWSNLLEERDKIRELFGDYRAILPNGHSVAIYYEGSMIIPSEDAQIRRLQVQLHIKEWGY